MTSRGNRRCSPRVYVELGAGADGKHHVFAPQFPVAIHTWFGWNMIAKNVQIQAAAEAYGDIPSRRKRSHGFDGTIRQLPEAADDAFGSVIRTCQRSVNAIQSPTAPH
jgi:hypothetical protein